MILDGIGVFTGTAMLLIVVGTSLDVLLGVLLGETVSKIGDVDDRVGDKDGEKLEGKKRLKGAVVGNNVGEVVGVEEMGDIVGAWCFRDLVEVSLSAGMTRGWDPRRLLSLEAKVEDGEVEKDRDGAKKDRVEEK